MKAYIDPVLLAVSSKCDSKVDSGASLSNGMCGENATSSNYFSVSSLATAVWQRKECSHFNLTASGLSNAV